MVTYGILLLTSVISGVCFYLYHQETDTKIQYEKQKETVRLEAKNLLENVPSTINYYNPGENEGLLLSTLALLERNKDIFPETYEAYKLEVIQKMKNADNESDIFRKRANGNCWKFSYKTSKILSAIGKIASLDFLSH